VEPQRVPLMASTWGSGKNLSTWDSPRVGELAVATRRAELRTVAAAARATEPRAALERAARELLAMQSSDWAFMVTRELAGDYPSKRMEYHGRELEAALASLGNGGGAAPEPEVRGLAPDLDLAALTTP
jgi:1,4-alpha-glucan branching enzyme